MKLVSFAFATVATMALVSCKSGTVSGKVIDPFTGQPVTNATVWIEGTPKQTKTADGSFRFEEVELGELKLSAGKNKFSKTQEMISVTETSLEVQKDIYIFSKETVDPGLFTNGALPATKITNLWLNWEVQCKESLFAYRKSFMDAKTKKALDLPDAEKSTAEVSMLFFQQSSVSEAVEVKSFPLIAGKVADHKDCSGFDSKETDAMFPDITKGTSLTSTYKSDMLYEVKGTLPKGKQVLAFLQGGKVVKTYLFEVK